jgi:hypothetical protein
MAAVVEAGSRGLGRRQGPQVVVSETKMHELFEYDRNNNTREKQKCVNE